MLFPFYVKKLHKDTFKENYEKSHKHLIEIQPYTRIVYSEESPKRMNNALFKDAVNGGEMPVEKMYSTEVMLDVRCKMMFLMNDIPDVIDAGTIDGC